jgi:hypothetical protein
MSTTDERQVELGGPRLRIVAAWALSRLLVLSLLGSGILAWDGSLISDAQLFWNWANDIEPSLVEYPAAARLLLTSASAFPTATGFALALAVAMLALDLWVLLILDRHGRRGAWLWVVSGAALGPILWLRYDLIVSFLVLMAVVLRDRRPIVSGSLLGLAILLKLWPVVVAAAIFVGVQRLRWTVAAVGTVAAGVVIDLVSSGWESLTAPIRYQLDRGIQIESLPGSWTLIRRSGEDPEQVWEFAFRSYQLRQDADGLALVGSALLLVVIVGVLLRVWNESPSPSVGTRATGTALVVVSAVTFNTVLSPQYVTWFLPLVALAVSVMPRPAPTSATTVAVALLTQLTYPWLYREVVYLQPAGLAVLAARNVLLVVLVGILALSLAKTSSSQTGNETLAATPGGGP